MFFNIKNLLLNKREELSSKQRVILDIICLLFLFLTFYSQSHLLDVPLIEDEIYHVTDNVAHGLVSSINPFSLEYSFLGHPPGYRLSLFAWFQIFPTNHWFAHLHAYTFTFFTIFLFYQILFYFSNWITSFTGTFFLFSLPYFINYSSLCYGNIPELFLFLLCIYLSLRDKKILLSISFILLVMTRESGIAFGFAFLLAKVLENKSVYLSLKKNILVVLPGFIMLASFFAITYSVFGKLSTHPYATNSLGHLSKDHTFLSLDKTKLHAFELMLQGISDNLSVSLLLFLFVSFALIIFFRKSIHSKFKFILNINFFIFIQYFIFYILYGDYAFRDSAILITLISLHLILSFYYFFPRLKGALSIICLGLIYLSLPSKNFTNYRYEERIFYKQVALKVQNMFEGKSICLPIPISFNPNDIHGLYTFPLRFKSLEYHYRNCEIVSTFQFQPKDQRIKINTLVAKYNLEPVYEGRIYFRWFKFYDFSSISFD